MTNWTDDQLEDLRDYIALGYTLDFIVAMTEWPRLLVIAKMDELGITSTITGLPEVTKPSGAGQATAAAVESPAAAMTSVQEASADASAGVQGRIDEPHPAPFPAPTSMAAPARSWRWDEMTKEERVAEVSRLRIDGASNRRIADALRTNRNTICGFCDRYKASLPPSRYLARGGNALAKKVRAARGGGVKPTKGAGNKTPRMTTPMPAPRLKAPQPPSPEPILPPDPSATVPLIDAGARRCHYPLWGNSLPAPSMTEGLCCGMPTAEGHSYCAHHHALTHSGRILTPVTESAKSTMTFPKRRAA